MYDLLTAWEVFEHLADPMAEIEKMLNYSDNIFFSTILLPASPKPLDQWWYYGLEHGQHVSFYTRETLSFISKKHNLKLHHSSSSVHLMGKKQIHPIKTRIIFGHPPWPAQKHTFAAGTSVPFRKGFSPDNRAFPE